MVKYGLKIVGAGYSVPKRKVSTEELETMMEFEKFGIRKGMSKLLSGVSERGFAEDNEDSSDYAVRASKMALESANLKPEDIDLLIFCSITSDFLEPATAMKIREDLGCSNANCYDIKNACNAFLTGMEIANMYIETGRAKNVLLCSGEILSRYLKLHYDTPEEIANANATFSLGDAGGALIVSAKEIVDEKDKMKSIFQTSSEFWNDGILWGGGTHYAHNPEMAYFQNETRQMIKTNFAKASAFYASAINTYIFPKEVVENSNFSGINYHNALLPHHRGMNAEAWSIFSMDKTTGITWHEIAVSVDKGGIIAQRGIPLDDKITSFKLLNIQLEAAYKAFTEFAPDFIKGKLKVTPQDKKPSEFHYIKDVPNNGIINSEWSMDKISAFLRAMDYGMFYTLGKPVLEYNGKRYSCGRYRISETSDAVSDDMILMDNNTVTIKKQGSNIIVKLLNVKEISE